MMIGARLSWRGRRARKEADYQLFLKRAGNYKECFPSGEKLRVAEGGGRQLGGTI